MTNNRDGRQWWMTDNGDDRQRKWQIIGKVDNDEWHTMEMIDNGNDRQWGL